MRRIGIGSAWVTEIGLGTAQLGDLFEEMQQETATRIVDAAWQGGVRYFDTAPHYGLGLAEERLGIALAARPREDYALSTKVGRLVLDVDGGRIRRWDFSADGIRRSLDASRRRLGTERIDIALIHDPDEHLDESIDSAYPALAELRARGEVGAVGVGTQHLPSLLRFVRETDVDVVMVAGRLTLLDHSALEGLVAACGDRGVRIIGAGVFNSGILASPLPSPRARYDYRVASPELVARARELAGLADRYGYSLPEAAMAFARHRPEVASLVIGADSVEQLESTLRAAAASGDRDGLVEAVIHPETRGETL